MRNSADVVMKTSTIRVRQRIGLWWKQAQLATLGCRRERSELLKSLNLCDWRKRRKLVIFHRQKVCSCSAASKATSIWALVRFQTLTANVVYIGDCARCRTDFQFCLCSVYLLWLCFGCFMLVFQVRGMSCFFVLDVRDVGAWVT